jgi:hypothetical protein
VDTSPAYHAQKIAFGGSSSGLEFDSKLTWDGSTVHVDGQVLALAHRTDNRAGDGVIAFYATVMAAGGTNRWQLYCNGDAPSLLGGALTVNGALTCNSTLTVSGGTSLGNNVTVAGTLAVSQGAAFSTTLYVAGATTLQTTLNVGGACSIGSLAYVGDPATSRNTLGLGTMAVQNATAVAITGGTASFSTLYVAGTTTLQTAVNVGGTVTATALSSSTTLYAGGATTLQTTLAVGGQSTLNGLVSVGLGVSHANIAGDSVVSFYSTLAAAGGTNRWFVRQDGDAPSYFLGHVAMGAAASLTNFHLYIGYQKQTNYGLVFRPQDNDTGGGYAIRFMSQGGAEVGSINTTGSGTSFNTTSDARLKEGIVPLQGSVNVIQALRPVAFRWRADGTPGHGFLAHEVQALVPEAVTGTPDGDVQGMDASKLMPYVVAGLKEVMERLERLEGRYVAGAD